LEKNILSWAGENHDMKSARLHGLLPPIITPFDDKGEVDFDALSRLIDFVKPWVHGFYVCGTYGLGPVMRPDQRKKTAEKIINSVESKYSVIVHVGAPDTQTAVELARHAEDIGARAIASVPPFYYRHSEKAVVKFFEELVRTVSIPVYVYNNPPRVGYPVTPELALKLKSIGVRGVKDSSFDVQTFVDYKLIAGEDFDVVVGTEALMLPTFVLGAQAWIPGMSNYLPELVFKLYQALINREWERARELQLKVCETRKKLHSLGSTIELSYVVLKIRGIDAGFPRSPFHLPDVESLRSQINNIIAPILASE
jgi:N-acetylneuraminate lyase/4-hydroxy-tetrahydrodipicolinate synthase